MNSYIQYNMIKKISFSEINFYFIIEKDFFISYETQKIILTYYTKKIFQYIIKINIQTAADWNIIYNEYQQIDLFTKKKILLITIDTNIVKYDIYSKIDNILKYNNKNIISILRIVNLNYKNNFKIFKNVIQPNHIIIDCPYLTIKQTTIWIQEKIITMNFYLSKEIIDYLAHHYQKNLLILFKILEILQITSFNTYLTKNYVKNILTNNTSYNIKEWIYALFSQNKLQAIHMLQIFKKQKYEISHLLKIIKNHLIYLIHIKENYIYSNYFKNYNKHIIFFDKKFKYTTTIKNMNNIKLYKIFNILMQIEINYKKFQHQLLWDQLKILIAAF